MKGLLLVLLAIYLSGCALTPSVPDSTVTPFPTLPLPTTTIAPTETAAPSSTAKATETPTNQATLVPLAKSPTKRPTARPTSRPTEAPTVEPTDQPIPEPSGEATIESSDPVLVGAGDIAVCEAKGDEATAQILDGIDGTVFTLGDNVYPKGTLQEFQDCYDPSWGRFKAHTHPVAGNHDYVTAGASGYYEYFGASAGDPARGYYAYDVGTWHIIVLNSEVATGENSVQVQWLREELTQHPTKCTLAMFHRPLFSSGPHGHDGSGDKTLPLWNVLYENDADVILNGHDHIYERFAPQDPQGKRDNASGIREFVVGTGGASPYPVKAVKPNSEKHFAGPFGVLKLTLHAASYDWEFVSVAPLVFRDHGTGECH